MIAVWMFEATAIAHAIAAHWLPALACAVPAALFAAAYLWLTRDLARPPTVTFTGAAVWLPFEVHHDEAPRPAWARQVTAELAARYLGTGA